MESFMVEVLVMVMVMVMVIKHVEKCALLLFWILLPYLLRPIRPIHNPPRCQTYSRHTSVSATLCKIHVL